MPFLPSPGQRPEEWYFIDPDDAAFLADSGRRLTVEDFLTDPPLEEGYDYEEESGEVDANNGENPTVWIVGGLAAAAGVAWLLFSGRV